MGRRDVIKIASEDKVKADDQSREESFESHTSNPTPSELNPISEKRKTKLIILTVLVIRIYEIFYSLNVI